MAQGFFTVFTGTRQEDDAEGPSLRSPGNGKSPAHMKEEVETAEIGRLSTVVDVVRSDLCHLEAAVAECRRDNSRTLAEVLRRQEDLIQSGTAPDHGATRDPLQITLLEEFVLDQVRQERRARAEELSEVRRWVVELVHGCMQPPSTGGVGSRSSTGSRCSTRPSSSGGVGTRRAANKASTLLDTTESTACSASDISNDVRFGVAAMKVQLSELQDEFVRSQDRLSMLAARVAALEQGEGGHEAPTDGAASLARSEQQSVASSLRLEDSGAIAELLTRERVELLTKAVPPNAIGGGDRVFHAVSAMRELREDDAVPRQEDLARQRYHGNIARGSPGASVLTPCDKLASDIRTTPPGIQAAVGGAAVVGQSTPKRTAPWAVSDAPHVSSNSRLPALALDAPVVAIAPMGLTQPATPKFRPDSLDAVDSLDAGLTPQAPPQSKSRTATGRSSMTPPPGQRCLNSRADSPSARLFTRQVSPAGSPVAAQADSLLPHTFCGAAATVADNTFCGAALPSPRNGQPSIR